MGQGAQPCSGCLLAAACKHKMMALCSDSCSFKCPNISQNSMCLLLGGLGSKMDVGVSRFKLQWPVGFQIRFLDFSIKVGGSNLSKYKIKLLAERSMCKHRKM